METNKYIYLTNDELVLYDPGYRYKVNKPIFNYGIKKGTHITIFENSNDFAKSIHIEYNILCRIISINLSCGYKIDKATNNIYFIGRFESTQIIEIICRFIRNYLLCIICGLPEVELKNKNSKIKQRCKCCGNNSYINEELSVENSYDILLKYYKSLKSI